MHLRLALIVVVVIACSARAQDGSVKKELARLEGTWDIVRGVERGEATSEYLIQNLKFVFKEDQFTFAGDEILMKKLTKVTVKIDAGTTPKCIDLKVEAGDLKGLLLEGIYECKGDDLKICVAEEPGNRPLEFESKKGSNRVVFFLKRQKP
jgi:uncharacterized protein (TIGR03067 family)